MAELPWAEFATQFPHSHLVMGIYTPTARGEHSTVEARQALLRRLILRQRPQGDYALAEDAEGTVAIILVAFAIAADAMKLTKATFGLGADRYRGYSSQTDFRFNQSMFDTIERALDGWDR